MDVMELQKHYGTITFNIYELMLHNMDMDSTINEYITLSKLIDKLETESFETFVPYDYIMEHLYKLRDMAKDESFHYLLGYYQTASKMFD